ncbi:IstB-like ATP binding protein [Thermoanaerobacter kivui]|uniref:IstB-like ATP binding protein n=1 Tax=Thermoanaerobacter kivui TaxID=2325 RepID=A0A097AUQ1_THEKI|nr:ATP-binding protein [Thermoanaerobacter kivui]AIS53523.1 IstB-like ATP binding protein [Thermoanaerobacter kivui]
MNDNIIHEILKEYEMKRDTSLKEALRRKNRLYKEIPELEKIDESIKNIGIEITQAIFKEPDKAKDLLNSLKERLNNLKKQKASLLISHGYSEDYLEPKYECNICKDTGYVNGKRCKCFDQKLINIYYKQSSIEEILKRENFSNFNFEYYSDKPYGDKPSPRSNMREIVEFSLNFIKNFDTYTESLFFYGDSGLGKTFLANCIAKELLDRGKSVIYRTASDLIEGLRINKLNPDSSTYSEYLDLLKNCDLLIIDDLGTEPITAFSLQEFFNLLNTRLLADKKFIISTNLPLSEIMAIYPERIYSRIFGHFKLLNFYGEDIRLKRKMII